MEGRARRGAPAFPVCSDNERTSSLSEMNSAEAECLLLGISEQRQVDPTHETEDRLIGRLVAFSDRLDDPRRQEAQPQQPPHRAFIQVSLSWSRESIFRASGSISTAACARGSVLSRTARPPKITLRSAVGDNMMIRGSAKMVLEIILEARSLIAVLSATAKALRLAVLTKVRQYRRERNCSF